MSILSSILATVLTNAGEFEGLLLEIENEFQAIVHGEGGAAKVATALANAAQIAGTVAAVVSQVKAAGQASDTVVGGSSITQPVSATATVSLGS